jgi:hypothetical protein
MEKDFLFLANFFHFGMEQMEPKKIKTVVAHVGWVARVEYSVANPNPFRRGRKSGWSKNCFWLELLL